MKNIYLWGTKVKFYLDGMEKPEVGFITVVDPHGYFGQETDEPSYDIYVPDADGTLYKHIVHRHILEVLPQSDDTRGKLCRNERTEQYEVLVSVNGYRALVERYGPMEIKPVWEETWIPAYNFDYEKHLGEPVEIRHTEIVLKVDNLFHALQDDENMICEVYRCDDTVVLMDGGYFDWADHKRILRGNKTCALHYRDKRVYRWDFINGIMRICLGPVEHPPKRVCEMAEEFVQNRFGVPAKRRRVLEAVRFDIFKDEGLSRMINWAGSINREKGCEIITPVTGAGFAYKKDGWVHKVLYEHGFITDLQLIPEEDYPWKKDE